MREKFIRENLFTVAEIHFRASCQLPIGCITLVGNDRMLKPVTLQ